MTVELASKPARVVTGFPIAPIIFPFLWLIVETSVPIPRIRVAVPVIFPFLWQVVDMV